MSRGVTADRYVGIDLGATNLRVALGDGDGTLLARTWRPTPQSPDAGGGPAATGDDSTPPTETDGSGVRTAGQDGRVDDAPDGVARAITGAIRDAVERVTTEAGVELGSVRAAGVAAPGPIDRELGGVRPPNLPVEALPLAGPTRAAIGGGRVQLVNDADAGALAERVVGDGPSNLAYLTISSGIGAGVIADDRLLRGAHDGAAEVGHTVVDPDGRMVCACGAAGHWEAYCSGDNLPRFARQLAETEGVSTTLSLETLDAQTLCAAAGDDPLADLTVARARGYNAVGVANLIHAYAPERVVFGGSVALENTDLFVDPLREELADLVVPRPELTTTAFGDWVGARGALAAVTDHGLD